MASSLYATWMFNLTEGVGIAVQSIRGNKVRAGLTILGIAVGVFVVTVMSAAVHGINSSVAKDLESAGPKTFFLSRYPITFEACDGTDATCKWRHNPPLTMADQKAMDALPSIRAAGARLDLALPVKYADRSLSGAQISAFTPNWIIIDGSGDLYPGRSWTQNEADAGQRVAVINDVMAKQLFGDSDPMDKTIAIRGEPFQVIGIYHSKASFLSGGDRSRAIIPIQTAFRVLNAGRRQISISVVPREDASRDEAIDEVTAVMRQHHGLRPEAENDFAIITQDKLFDTYNKVFGMFFLVMIVLSAVGLLVGGVGVVAIMMISVTERTREIGVRKALGATRATILWQFLVEAVTLTGIGAVIGLAAGILVALLVRSTTPIAASVPPLAIVAALGSSAITGVLFGLLPAARASRLDPVDALRYE
ncbi:MAG TPA: ABC transporter permease [Gemmatimonadaceae bacterium]|nr:ABC transporter permease [Gemmatimonadaceae bacterium]